MPRYDHDKKVLEKLQPDYHIRYAHLQLLLQSGRAVQAHIVQRSARRKKMGEKQRGWREKTLPASDVADDEGRRDNTGVGIATLSTAAGFLLVIMLQAELSILL